LGGGGGGVGGKVLESRKALQGPKSRRGIVVSIFREQSNAIAGRFKVHPTTSRERDMRY